MSDRDSNIIVVSEEEYLSVKQTLRNAQKAKPEEKVEGQAQPDTPQPVSVLSMPRNPILRAHPALGRGVRGTKPVKAWLSYYQGTSGAANTAFAFGWTLAPSLDSSWASWQSVFDEVRVLSAELMWNVYFTTIQSASPANAPNAIVVYDPTTTVSLASVNAGLQFDRFDLMRIQLPSATPFLVSPQNVTKGGYQKFHAKVPSGPTLSSSVTTNSTGVWRNTSDAAQYEWGNFAGYASVGGTSSVLRAEGFVRMLCEFRVRR
jgi:hypothetical protein